MDEKWSDIVMEIRNNDVIGGFALLALTSWGSRTATEKIEGEKLAKNRLKYWGTVRFCYINIWTFDLLRLIRSSLIQGEP